MIQDPLHKQFIVLKKIPFGWIAIAILSIILVYTFWSLIYTQLDELKLIPRPEPFTELYFDNPQGLPKTIVNNQKTNFSFVVHNVMGNGSNYRYRVFITYSNGESNTLDEKSIYLENDERIVITETFVPIGQPNMAVVTVELPDLKQHINFSLKK